MDKATYFYREEVSMFQIPQKNPHWGQKEIDTLLKEL
jgi:hypothetical protein